MTLKSWIDQANIVHSGVVTEIKCSSNDLNECHYQSRTGRKEEEELRRDKYPKTCPLKIPWFGLAT